MKCAQKLILLLLLFTAYELHAQNSRPERYKRCPVKTINFETGLLNNGTNNIISDKLGFTWVSTQTGLQRYNGNNLQTIVPVIGKDTFHLNFPVYFFGLKGGGLWISFKQSVLRYNPGSNSFSKIITLQKAGNSRFNIVPLQETNEGIWCMQENKGIVIYDRDGKLKQQFSNFDTSVINKVLNSSELLYQRKIASDENNIFINGNGSNFNYTSIDKNPNILLAINTRNKTFRTIGIDEPNILGLSCRGENLCVLSSKKILYLNSGNYKIKKTIAIQNLSSENISSGAVEFTGKGGLLLALNNHLFQLDTAGNYQYELTGLNRNPLVATGFIFQIYPDRFGRIWLRTNNDIKRVEDLEIPFAHFIYPDEKNNFIRTIYYDEQKQMVIAGSFYSGIQLYDTMANPLMQKPVTYPALKNILSIEKLTSNDYLIITFDKGWFLFNLPTRQVRPYSMPQKIENILQPLQMNFPNNVQRISNNTLLVATANNIFRCITEGVNLVSAIPLLPAETELKGSVVGFLLDKNKNLWVGTYKGKIARLNPKGELQNILWPGEYGIRCFAEDALHNVWVGTDKGLYVFTGEGKLIKEFTSENGLRNDCIYAILPADKGATVYASSNLGISAISLDGNVKNFTKEMGLQDNEFNTNAATKNLAGRFFFGGINGISAFYPASLTSVNDSPFLYVTRLVVNDSLFNPSSGIWAKDSVLLNYNQNRLRFDIAAIGLLNANEYVYQYRLSGFEEQWQTTYQPTGINYILEPGKYTLEISCNPIMSSKTKFYKNIVIIITPPWWQAWWFKIGIGAIILMVIVFFVHRYNREKFLKKIQLLENQNNIQKEKERISRDLHDHLGVQANAILYNTELLKQEEKVPSALVTNLHDTAKQMMISLRETLWAMNNTDTTAPELWLRLINFSKVMGRHYQNIHFSTQGTPPQSLVLPSLQALDIVMLVQEALNNASKHAQGTNIIIHSSVLQDTWDITVEDDGKGFDFTKEGQKYDAHGLKNMQERARNTGAILQFDSQANQGTKIIIKIPFA